MRLFYLLCLFFCLAPLYARSVVGTSYPYVQINQAVSIGTTIKTSYYVDNTDEDGNVISRDIVSNNIGTRLGDIWGLSNFITGYHFSSSTSLEVEFASYDIHGNSINGEEVSNSQYSETNFRYDYMTFNYKSEFLTLEDVPISFFYKLGFGVTQINRTAALSGNGGLSVDPILQLDFGMYYEITPKFGLEIYYKALANYSKLDYIYSVGTEYQANILESTLNFSVRYNLTSDQKGELG